MKLVYKVLKGVQSLVLHCPTKNIGSYQSSVLLRVHVGKQGPRGAMVRATEVRASWEGPLFPDRGTDREQSSLMKIGHAGQSNEQGMVGSGKKGPSPSLNES